MADKNGAKGHGPLHGRRQRKTAERSCGSDWPKYTFSMSSSSSSKQKKPDFRVKDQKGK